MMTTAKYKVRKIDSLKDLLNQSKELFGEKDAFLIKDNTGEYKGIKYNDFKQHVDALGTMLINMGLKDTNIAIIGENRYEWCVSYLGIVNGTGTVIPLDKELPYPDLENLLIKSRASALIYTDKFKDMVNKLPTDLNVKYFINMDLKEDDQNILSFNSLILKGKELIKEGNNDFIEAKIDDQKMSMLIFTSGTTDAAKGVMLSHKNICSNIMAVCSTIEIMPSDRVLSILPLHHTYECTGGFLLMIYSGAQISFNEGLKYIAKNIKEVRPTILILVPLILESMYKKIWEQASKKITQLFKLKLAIKFSNFLMKLNIDKRNDIFKVIHENFGGQIRLIISGAAAIDPDVSKGLNKFGFTVLQGYGLTECSPVVSFNIESDFKNNSIGFPIPGVELKLEDINEDGIGEIVVKGDNIMLGYYNNQSDTEEILKDGWLYTGDLGRIDNEGYVYITGRKKNMIVTKNGKNIFPEEIEGYLNKSPFIKETLVYGEDEEISGETTVVAVVFPDIEYIEQKFLSSEINKDFIKKIINNEIKYINSNLPLYKRIRKLEIRDQEFEKTTTKKIKRKGLIKN